MEFNWQDDNDTVTRIDWHELKNRYLAWYEDGGDRLVSSPMLKEFLVPSGRKRREGENWRTGGSFYGPSMEEMAPRLRQGYEFDSTIAPQKLPDVAYDRPRPRYTDDSEGEFNYDLYYQGETEYFLNKPKRKSVGGIRIRAEYVFAAGVSHQMITEYAQWLGTVIQSLQARGFDLEIELFSRVESCYRKAGKPWSSEDRHYIRVSRFGERIMPWDWSALFSPGGYRHFMFATMMLPAEETELNVAEGLGHTLAGAWDIKWHPRERVIEITNDSRGYTFPAEDMTKRFESWKE